MPVVIYPVGINTTDEADHRQHRAASIFRRRGNVLAEQLSAYFRWRCLAHFRCSCRNHLPGGSPPKEFLHCPVRQTPERLIAHVPASCHSMLAARPADLTERMRLGGCYRPWVDTGYYASSLHWGAVKGDCQLVQKIVKALPHAVFSTDRQGNTPLMLAAAAAPACVCEESGGNCVVETLLTHCVPRMRAVLVRLGNNEGLTALHFAALNGRVEVVQLLIQYGADPDGRCPTSEEERSHLEKDRKKCEVTEDKKNSEVIEDKKKSEVTEDKKKCEVTEDKKKCEATEGKKCSVKKGKTTEDKKCKTTEDKTTEDKKCKTTEDKTTEDKKCCATEDKKGTVTEEDKGTVTEEDKKGTVTEEDKKGRVTEEDKKHKLKKDQKSAATQNTKYGVTPLHLAIISRRPGAAQCVRLLLQAGANVEAELLVWMGPAENLKIECGCGGCWSSNLMSVVPPGLVDHDIAVPFGSALMLAVCMLDADKVSVLLEGHSPVNVNYRDGVGRRPLYYAAASVNTRILKMLVQNQADLNVRYNASINGSAQESSILHILLSHSLQQPSRNTFDNCLWCRQDLLVSEEHLLQAVETFVDSPRCSINARDCRGYTPLLVAVEKGYVKCCRSLLRHGADPLAATSSGHTSLYFACKLVQEEVRDEVLTLLLQHGVAQPTSQQYSTPWNWCSRTSPFRVVLQYGDRRSLVRLYRAGALCANTLRGMQSRVQAHLHSSSNRFRNAETKAKQVEFSQTISGLMGSLPSLSDMCLHVVSSTMGVGSTAMRNSRLEAALVQTIRQMPGDDEEEEEEEGTEAAHKPILATIQQRMKVLHLL